MKPHRLYRFASLVAGLLSVGAVNAQQAPPPAWQWSSDGLNLKAGLDTYTAIYSMSGTWWNLASQGAPTFKTSRSFGELWLHPSVKGHYELKGGRQIYGALSVGMTKTLSADAFDYDNQGEIRWENAYLGVRSTGSQGWRYDLSAGRQPFTLGTGMLLTAGSANGYSWGGGASTQRKAWGNTAIARLGYGEFTGQFFYVEPSEAPEAKTDTQVQGVSAEWSRDKVGKAGLAWIKVPKSTAIYPGNLAPLAFIENGRDGLETWHGWTDVAGLVPGLPALSMRAEFALQRNEITRLNGRRDPMKASAWLVGASYWAQDWLFSPKFTFHHARFSGDKPETSTYERFDPLFWGNGLDNWWFGANGAYSWLNANVRAQRFILDAYLSSRDVLQFQFVRVSADRLNSPIQYGQGANFSGGSIVVGVPRKHLADELYFQYARVFQPNLVAIAFVARSFPGAGLKATAPQGTQPWTTLGVGLTANF